MLPPLLAVKDQIWIDSPHVSVENAVANVLRRGGSRAILAMKESDVVRLLFGRVDAWVGWNHFPIDWPLASLWCVLVIIRGLFRPRGQPFMVPASAAKPPSGLGTGAGGHCTAAAFPAALDQNAVGSHGHLANFG